MKISLLLCLLVTMLLMANCASFPTSYEVIEDDKPRLLDFIYEPAEAAPGDTVLLKALFAGKLVTPEDLSWSMSQKIIINEYGASAALDTVPLEIEYKDFQFSSNTSCIAFTFVVPEKVLEESPSIPEQWSSLLPEYYQSGIPTTIPSSKKEILQLLQSSAGSDDANRPLLSDEISPYLPMVLQLFSAPIKIYCKVKNSHTIKSEYIVRYNSRFASIAQLPIPVNHNPHIDSCFLYSVNRPDLALFDPENCPYPFERVQLSFDSLNAITINRGKSYFLGVHNSTVDSTLSIDAVMGQSRPLDETITGHWYVNYDNKEKKGVGKSELIEIEDGIMYNNLIVSKFYPSLNDDITTVHLWVELRDSFLNEMNRPVGSTLGELSLHFSYTK